MKTWLLDSWQRIMLRIAPYEQEVLYGLVGLLLLAAICFWFTNRSRKQVKQRLQHALLMLERLQPAAGLENNLNAILELIGTIVLAPGYAFYILDTKNNLFTLKAVRNANKYPGKMAPSYSGLLPHNKETYLPMLTLPALSAPSELKLGKEGEIPLLSMPVGQNGLIRIAPLSRLSRLARGQLQFIANLLPRMLDLLIEADRMKMKTEVVITSGEALHAVGSMALDSEAVLSKMLSMISVALDVNASFVLSRVGENMKVTAKQGWSPLADSQFANTAAWVQPLISGSNASLKTILLQPGDALYSVIPRELITESGAKFSLSRFQAVGAEGILCCRIDSSSAGGWSEEERLDALRSAAENMSRLVNAQEQMKPLSSSYAELLKMVSRTIDNLNPYTVGYSELMALYSAAIAQEMRLPRKEIAAISLAAYLSNIGVLGLSEELYLKEGKFSETEFEKMKLHAEVGAAIVEMTIGDKAVADCIRYHHERMDGNGYPIGLKGTEIPVGARIIAVVQMFLAKIGGRKYREPLSFDKALGLVKSATGSQLDSAVVQALSNWIGHKRKSSSTVDNRPLGPCWEMCCAPSYMCQTCPAYEQEDKPCWEFERNNCQSHGKSCQSCFVYTETLGRTSRNVQATKL
jgi:HD-GYP domain-containing protein (c-di-GMP phosphodiesterase class II)